MSAMTKRRIQPFRRYKSRDEASWLPVIALGVLGALDLYLIVIVARGALQLWRVLTA